MLRFIIIITILFISTNANAEPENDRGKIYDGSYLILVSSSIEDSALANIFEDASKNKGTLIFKGFKNNSIKEHLNFLLKYRKRYPDVSIKVDPDVFEVTNTINVPTYLYINKYKDLDIYKITGFVGLNYFINSIDKMRK